MVAVTASPSQQLIGLTEMEENRTDIKRFIAPVSSGFFSPFLLYVSIYFVFMSLFSSDTSVKQSPLLQKLLFHESNLFF